jgi:hypothetical protein
VQVRKQSFFEKKDEKTFTTLSRRAEYIRGSDEKVSCCPRLLPRRRHRETRLRVVAIQGSVARRRAVELWPGIATATRPRGDVGLQKPTVCNKGRSASLFSLSTQKGCPRQISGPANALTGLLLKEARNLSVAPPDFPPRGGG